MTREIHKSRTLHEIIFDPSGGDLALKAGKSLLNGEGGKDALYPHNSRTPSDFSTKYCKETRTITMEDTQDYYNQVPSPFGVNQKSSPQMTTTKQSEVDLLKRQ